MNLVYGDFETQSYAALKGPKAVGAANYLEHPSTRVLCFGFFFDDGGQGIDEDAPMILTPRDMRPGGNACIGSANWLKTLAADRSVTFVFHNAAFDRRAWNLFMVPLGYPELPLHRVKCTMAKAYSYGLPGALEDAAKALGLKNQKDMEGAEVLQKLYKPNPKLGRLLEYDDCPADFERMYDYCRQDIRTTRELDQAIPDLIESERRIWMIDQVINDRGVLFDIPLIEKIVSFVNESKDLEKKDFVAQCGFNPTQRGEFQKWLKEKCGVEISNTKASTVEQIVESLTDEQKMAVDLFTSAGRSSLAKFPAILRRNKNGVVREMYQYYGAHTGRWAGRGVQTQNMARPEMDLATLVGAWQSWNYENFQVYYPDMAAAASSVTRGTIIARPAHEFYVGDYGQVEARAAAYIAVEPTKLAVFRSGADPYCHAASEVYQRTIVKGDPERQTGKIEELALGFGGGIGSFANFSTQGNLDLMPVYRVLWPTATLFERENAEQSYLHYLARCKRSKTPPVPREIGFVSDLIKQRWRKAHPNIVNFWAELERGMKAAINGTVTQVGPLLLFMHGPFLHLRLPSGRDIIYPFPRVTEKKGGGTEITYMFNSATYGWRRTSTYGGKAFENVVQGYCRDFMAGAMIRLADAGYEGPRCGIVLHTHDELVTEVPLGFGSIEEYQGIMAAGETWAPDFPMVVEVWQNTRYVK